MPPEPVSALHQEAALGYFHVVALLCPNLMLLKTFPCAHFILNEAKYIGHAAHRQKGMSIALNSHNSLYFAQEVWGCILKCHPLKVSSKYTETVQEHRQVS